MILFPNAKINIGLQVINKRPDGYHNIYSLFYPAPWHDALEIIPSKKFEIKIFGNKIEGDIKDNICYKAWQIIHDAYKIDPCAILLLKQIPSGAGLGGGSSDGAFCLRLFNDFYQLKLTLEQLKAFALQLGSDCPFFIDNSPKLVSGRGEILVDHSLRLTGKKILIVKPNVHIATAKAYQLLDLKTPKYDLLAAFAMPIETWQATIVNDFQAPMEQLYGVLAELNYQLGLSKPLYYAMSGSGSAYYAFYEDSMKLDQGLLAYIKHKNYPFIYKDSF